jgi:hypothetical protein
MQILVEMVLDEKDLKAGCLNWEVNIFRVLLAVSQNY